jgi:hypothetical protein
MLNVIVTSLYRDRLAIPDANCKQKMMSLGGKASWPKMTLSEGKLTALAYRSNQKVNKKEIITYLSKKINERRGAECRADPKATYFATVVA